MTQAELLALCVMRRHLKKNNNKKKSAATKNKTTHSELPLNATKEEQEREATAELAFNGCC